MHTDERREACQWPVGVGVTGRDPRKAGEHPAAQPFAQRERGRQHEQGVDRCQGRGANWCQGGERSPRPGDGARRPLCSQPGSQPSRERRIGREEAGKQDRCQASDGHMHAAHIVHADVDPGHPRAKPAHAKHESAQRGAARRGIRPDQEQSREQERLQPPETKRRKREDHRHTGSQCGGQPDAGVGDARGAGHCAHRDDGQPQAPAAATATRSTRRICTWRLSARST